MVKSRTNFITLSLKRNILPAIFCIFIFFLVIFSKSNLSATKAGINLWANNVLPSLLPFFIATELLSHTDVVEKLGRLLNRFMRPIFNVPGVRFLCFCYGNY